MVHSKIPMDTRALNAHNDTEIDTDPGDVVSRATIAALVIAGEVLNVANDGFLQLHESWTHLLVIAGLVLETLRQRFLLAVNQHGHPSFLVRLVFSLEVIRSVVADEVEAALVIWHRLDLTRQKIHSSWRFRFVSMANIKETVFGDSAATFLPNTTNFSLAFLVEVTGAGNAVVLIALQLMETVSSSLVRDDVLVKAFKGENLK